MNERFVFNPDGELLRDVRPSDLPNSNPGSFSGFQVDVFEDGSARVLGLRKTPHASQSDMLGVIVSGKWEPSSRSPSSTVAPELQPPTDLFDDRGRPIERHISQIRESEGQRAFPELPPIRDEIVTRIQTTLQVAKF